MDLKARVALVAVAAGLAAGCGWLFGGDDGAEIPGAGNEGASGSAVATPFVHEVEQVEADGSIVAVMRTALPGAQWQMGIAAVCESGVASIAGYFGPFPGTARPVQLAVQGPDESIERFGPVLQGGPQDGMHAPRIDEPEEIDRFVNAALTSGALISNGYNSFYNSTDAAGQALFRDTLTNCGQ